MKRDFAALLVSREMELENVAVRPGAVERELRVVTLYAVGILKAERPESDVHNMHTEIADRTVAVTDPAVPAVRMHAVLIGSLRIIVADRRAAAPRIPVEPLRRRKRCRARENRVDAVVVAPDLLDLAESAFVDAVDAVLHRREGMTVCSALGYDTWLFSGLFKKEIAFRRGKNERLVEIDVNPAANSHDRGENVLMVRRFDDNGVKLVADRIEHVLIGGELLNVLVILRGRRVAQSSYLPIHALELFRIGINDSDELFKKNRIDDHAALDTAADKSDSQLGTLLDLLYATLPETGAPDAK